MEFFAGFVTGAVAMALVLFGIVVVAAVAYGIKSRKS